MTHADRIHQRTLKAIKTLECGPMAKVDYRLFLKKLTNITQLSQAGVLGTIGRSGIELENWTDATIEKEFSLEIDVKDLDVLQINLRGGALNDTNNGEKASEIVPVDGELDQQNYPIQIADIEIYSLKK